MNQETIDLIKEQALLEFQLWVIDNLDGQLCIDVATTVKGYTEARFTNKRRGVANEQTIDEDHPNSEEEMEKAWFARDSQREDFDDTPLLGDCAEDFGYDK
jgi:hypothetical protein